KTIRLMKTFLELKASTSSKTIVYLSCPPQCGPFSYQEVTKGELSYKGTKSCAATLCALVRASISLHIHLRTSRILHGVLLYNRKSEGISYYMKRPPQRITLWGPLHLY
ncbi:MAG: hypothetical protein E7282_11115, partial [Lachnospiraceae bacterium]|nr:hypothetical protein [Lachnospiraceae bacterium]